MSDLIDRQKAIDALGSQLSDWNSDYNAPVKDCIDRLKNLPSAQPEQKIEELRPDGTLHLVTDADLSKVSRVLVSQNGTHFAALFYADGEPEEGQGGETERKTGRWESIPSLFGTLGICSVCHNVSGNKYEYCPWCGAKMEDTDGN